MGDKEIKIVCYADDAVIMSEDEDLQRLLYKFKQVGKRFKMQISIKQNITHNI